MFVRSLSAAAIAASMAASAIPAHAQSLLDLEQEEQDLGDIFAHPRDRAYTSGNAPSRARLFEFTEQYKDGRGDVARWEYRKGGTIIFREVWIDENGDKRGILQVGPSF